jgi:nickel/cobalt exporter
MILAGLAVAFVLGAAHALTPGHGKTIVAAYLVGSRGTLKHAAYLGAMVTFTHTISVFALGFATLFLVKYVMVETITRTLGAISGVSIVALGAWMLRKRLRAAAHERAHARAHASGHHHYHHHGPGGHTHVPEELSWGGLTALAASGGLVPCESALILLLGAIAIGRTGLGILLLLSFSLGLSVVLMAIGGLVLYAKHLIPNREHAGRNPMMRWIPVVSAAFVMLLGLLMTGVSLQWIQPKWMF